MNDVNGGSNLWTISNLPDNTAQEQVETTTINENDLLEKDGNDVPETTKKKKSQKNRRSSESIMIIDNPKSFHANLLLLLQSTNSSARSAVDLSTIKTVLFITCDRIAERGLISATFVAKVSLPQVL